MRFIPVDIVEGEVEGPDPDYWVLTPLAASEDGYQLVAVETRMLPDGEDEYELKFCVAVLDESSEEPFRIFDPDMARGYIPHEIRKLVVPSVLRSIKALIERVQPKVIHRVTFATRPHDKALEKHQMITDTIVALGLTSVTTGTDRYERKFWRMSKNGDEHGQD